MNPRTQRRPEVSVE